MNLNESQIKCVDATLQSIVNALLRKNEDKISVLDLPNKESKIAFGFKFNEQSMLFQTLKNIIGNQKKHHFYLNQNRIETAFESDLNVPAPFANFATPGNPATQLRNLLTPSLKQTAELHSEFAQLNSGEKERLQFLYKTALSKRPGMARSPMFLSEKKPKIRSNSQPLIETQDDKIERDKSVEKKPDFRANKNFRDNEILSDLMAELDLYDEVDDEFGNNTTDYLFDEVFDSDDDEDDEYNEDEDYDDDDEDPTCDCEVCTAKRKYKMLLFKAEKRQPKFYELDWDFMRVEGISKIAEKFEQLVGKIAIELKEQSQLARMHIFTFDSQFATNKYREIEQEHFNVLNSIGIDFMTLLSDSFARKPLSSLDIEHSIAKIVLKSQPILLQICQKSAASWFDLCKLYNANVTIIELHNLAVEYFQIMNDICEKLEFHRHSMIGSFKKILVKAQALKSSLFELTQNLSKFSNTRTATEQLSSNAVDKYFRDEINFKFEVQSDLISLLASELFASLNSNHVACLFALSLIKEDNGYYSSKLLEGENKYVHICLGDTAVSAAINKIVVQKEQFIDCTI